VTDYDRAASAYIRATAGMKRLAQDETAARAGIHINTFRHYWQGDRHMSVGDFRVIVEALGVTVEDGIKGVERLFESGGYV
jgi:transcriptional regulator with XRE-family HTH domain